MDLKQIQALTESSGGGWGSQHVRRVLALADCIAGDTAYDHEAFEYAVWLHDWGAYPAYAQPAWSTPRVRGR
jgi:HD superfamily phosphodiesterase